MINYMIICHKYAKLNLECFFMLLGCDAKTDKSELSEMLENECPVFPINKDLMKGLK